MDMSSIGKITETVAICPVCGDDTVGNGSKFIVEDNTFERTCRHCGWRITGRVENGMIVVTSDNRNELMK